MTDQIYNYQDEKNYFIAKFDAFNDLTCFGGDETYESLQDAFHQLTKALKIDKLQVHVAMWGSIFSFYSFLIDTINHQENRQLKLVQHQGALLVTEANQVLMVHLPKEGLSLEEFFGKSSETNTIGDTILIATRNEGKTKEFRKLFGKLGLKVENLNDYPDLPEVAETGLTFEENARLKAETISQLTNKMVLADDSGLMVDVLGGMPGVWSARFAGPDATDAANNAKLLHELAMVFDMENRTAHFHTTLVVASPNKESLVVEADWDGYIATIPKGENGFGYDPLFLVGETGKTSAELSAEEKNEISHRGQAVKKLMEVFPSWQNTD
ncbi:nucleoside-triphosphate diphosphatase [Streptococcus porcorum]|uniref:dITP/XTP pyrophosphatase n=1 Tax=Streptococcus porcorum TaxID=701526 RepID=A0ABV2JJB6_9STRE